MDFTSQGRSNFFRVVYVDNFKEYCKENGLQFITEGPDSVRVGFICPDGLPSISEEVEGGGIDYETVERDILYEIASLLCDQCTLVYQEVGSEGPRYISGWAEALDNTGKRVALHLESIYEVAVAAGMSKPTNCSY